MSISSAGTGVPGSPCAQLAPLLSMRQVATILGISVSKTYVLVGSGAIASNVVGERSRRVEPAALEQYIAGCTAHSGNWGNSNQARTN